MKKLTLIIPAFILLFNISAYSQCESCDSRTVALYDIKVLVEPPPAGATNEINTFIKLLGITGHALAYFVAEDPMMYCNNFINVVSAYPADALNYADIAGMQTAPENTSEQDYYIYGIISGSAGSYTAVAGLAVGKTQYIFKTSTVNFGDDFDPGIVADQLGAGLSSVYVNIMDYEKEKRDEGEPYAITPQITLEPEKKKVDFNESTPVHITVMDCDGEPLKNRQIHLTVDGGTLDADEVTTDDQGTSFVLFTAGSQPEIAFVQAEFSYTTPPEKNRDCPVEPAAIQIKKPEDAWYVQGTYKTKVNYNFSEDGSIPGVQSYLQSGVSQTNRDLFYAAWVKRQPIPYHPLEFATTTDDPISIKYRATESVTSDGKVSWSNSNSSITEQTHVSTETRNTENGESKLYISIGNTEYGFSLTLIDSYRTGQQFYQEDIYDPINGHDHNESTTSLDGDTHLGMNVQNANWDTTYTVTETNPEAGETTVTNVTQTFSWDNERCKLNYSSTLTDTQDLNLFGVQSNSASKETKTVTFWMSYSGDAPSGAGENISEPDGLLYQNSPNPFDNTTRIRYTLTHAQHVGLKVIDMYGCEIAVLSNETQLPGLHEAIFDASRLPAGTYFYRLEAGNTVEVKKLMVVK